MIFIIVTMTNLLQSSCIMLNKILSSAAVNGDMGWPAPEHRQWMCITRKWCRLINLDESFITKKSFQGSP